MSIIKSFSVKNGDTFYIKHNSPNFTVIDCNLIDERKEEIMDEICKESKGKTITRFISTHPDDDHIKGIEYYDERSKIINFYCVENKVTKEKETDSFKKYCELRDSEKTFFLKYGCERAYLNKNGKNENGEEIGSSGLFILWPKTDNKHFKEALKQANDGKSPNNISPVIQYSLEKGVNVLWFGDLEYCFMEDIEDVIELPQVDVVFAPHHGRDSGELPTSWLDKIKPKVIVIGEASSDNLNYYPGYNTITQNSAKDITMVCEKGKVHFYSSNDNYAKRSYLTDEALSDDEKGYYIGTLKL